MFAHQSASPRIRSRFSRDFLSFLRFVMPHDAFSMPGGLRSMSEVLRRRAVERPNQTAFTFLPDCGERSVGGEVRWTYADLDRRASAVAAALSRRAAAGDRAVLVFPPGLDFIAAFFGCLYAGVLPVPATYPKPRRASSRLDAICADCTPRFALTTSDMLNVLQLEEQSDAVREATWIAVDECEPVDDFRPVERKLDDPAFLQYTSGSTSQPRGVIVTHGNLLHNLALIGDGFGISSSDATPTTAVFWLPAYHDMGLIGGILVPLFVGGTSHLLAPAAFLQRPHLWLETLSRTKAAISGAPNFAYELCTRKISPQQRDELDLRRWKIAFCGAEPISAEGLNEFAEGFESAGFRKESFYPCYGLAEATLMVTGGKGAGVLRTLRANKQSLAENMLVAAHNGDASQTLVGCGKPLGNQDVRVVDPQSFEPRVEGAIGEIWVRGGSVASGYWNHPEELWQTFGGRLADGSGPFLRTGDLGAFHHGELYVTGRAKDVIIIRGRNLYPQDVERTAQEAHEAVDQGAAFSVNVNEHEQLVVVHQVHREHRRGDLTPVIRAVRAAVVEEHEVDPYAIVLLRPGALPLTSSGKVQRSRCRELFENNELEELTRSVHAAAADHAAGPGASASDTGRPGFMERLGAHTPETLAVEIQQWILAWLAERVEMDAAELAPTAAFTELGMDSLTALELNVEFEKVLGIQLPPTAALSFPTPAALSQFLAESLLGMNPQVEAAGNNGVDSWFLAMEADARRP
jgi:acyl-CoA synthetase (AMP-forming)/AMP-acid ligase II/acyl carrier protein